MFNGQRMIVTCSHHLNLTDFEVGASCSVALQGKAKTSYPRVSRGSFLAGYRFFSVSLRTFFIYLFSFFQDLDSRIHIPIHPVSTFTYVCPFWQSQFFLSVPTYAAYLTGCKITVYFYKIFPTFFQLISKHRKELPISVILYPFSKVQTSGYPFQVQIFHTYRIILLRKVMTELMMEIFPLVLYPFIT